MSGKPVDLPRGGVPAAAIGLLPGAGEIGAALVGHPDVAAIASGNNLGAFVFVGNASRSVGGTSLATPVWAGAGKSCRRSSIRKLSSRR